MYNINKILHKHKDLKSSDLLLLFGLKYLVTIRGEDCLLKASNQELCSILHVTEPTLIQSRNRLIKKEIISFFPGKARSCVSKYMIIDNKNQSICKSDNLIVELEHVKLKLQKDETWQNIVVDYVRNLKNVYLTLDDLKYWLNIFFNKLSIEGIKNKNVQDTKSHFFNWLLLQVTQRKYIINRDVKIEIKDGKFKQGGDWHDLLSRTNK